MADSFDIYDGPKGVLGTSPSAPLTTDALIAERGTSHGDYDCNCDTTAALMAEIRVRAAQAHGSLDAFQAESLHMICHKIARIVCGNRKFADHWDDIAGYAKLVADRYRKT